MVKPPERLLWVWRSLRHKLQYDTAIPFLGVYPKDSTPYAQTLIQLFKIVCLTQGTQNSLKIRKLLSVQSMPKGKKCWGGKLLRYLCKDSMDGLGACVDILSTKSPASPPRFIPHKIQSTLYFNCLISKLYQSLITIT